MSITAVENGVRNWIKIAGSLDDNHVFFSHQKIERPTGPYIVLHVTSVIPLGANDATMTIFDGSRPAGSEFEIKVIGERKVVISVQGFNFSTTGSGSAVEKLSAIQLGLGLSSVGDALDDASISIYDFDEVRDLSMLLGTAFDGRAMFDAYAYVRLTISEFTTWIQRVEGTVNGVPYTMEDT